MKKVFLKKPTRKKAAKKRAVKKVVKRRKPTTKKSALAMRIDEYNAVANKALKNAEEMTKKAKATTDSRLKRSYNYRAKQLTEIARIAQRNAVNLIAKKK